MVVCPREPRLHNPFYTLEPIEEEAVVAPTKPEARSSFRFHSRTDVPLHHSPQPAITITCQAADEIANQ